MTGGEEVAAIACGAHVIASYEYHPDIGTGGLHERERKGKRDNKRGRRKIEEERKYLILISFVVGICEAGLNSPGAWCAKTNDLNQVIPSLLLSYSSLRLFLFSQVISSLELDLTLPSM